MESTLLGADRETPGVGAAHNAVHRLRAGRRCGAACRNATAIASRSSPPAKLFSETLKQCQLQLQMSHPGRFRMHRRLYGSSRNETPRISNEKSAYRQLTSGLPVTQNHCRIITHRERYIRYKIGPSYATIAGFYLATSFQVHRESNVSELFPLG
jgi:hypothetical protein